MHNKLEQLRTAVVCFLLGVIAMGFANLHTLNQGAKEIARLEKEVKYGNQQSMAFSDFFGKFCTQVASNYNNGLPLLTNVPPLPEVKRQ